AMVAIFVGRANDDYYRGVRDETIHEFYVYVELPEEETCEDPEPMVGKLLKTMYGTVDASHVWQDDYIGLTSSRGFQKGISIPAVLYHADRQMQAEVHGDGFGVIMKKSQGGWLDEVLSRHDFKVAGLPSSRATSEQSVVYLNRVPVWGPIQWSAYLEADARRVKKVIRDLGLESAKEVTAPAVRLSVSDVPKTDRESQKLDDEKVKTYRSVTMRIMCPSLDRSDIGYGREYAGEGGCCFHRRGSVCCDSDCAGGPTARRSRSGMAMLWGSHLLKHGSAVHSTVGLGSGEAEYYALLRGSWHGFGVKAMLRDLGAGASDDAELQIFSDSSAARGILSRRGLGADRRIDVRFLWLQERVQNEKMLLKTIEGYWIPADLSTKTLDQETTGRLLRLISFTMKADGNV
ncbi:unnamed protein product, partial [Prorocentrum cordatum]